MFLGMKEVVERRRNRTHGFRKVGFKENRGRKLSVEDVIEGIRVLGEMQMLSKLGGFYPCMSFPLKFHAPFESS